MILASRLKGNRFCVPNANLVLMLKEDSKTLATEKREMAYKLIKKYVEHLGGELEWMPGGTGGAGDWRIELGGKVALVPYRDQPWCELDMLKEPKVKNPQTSNDYCEKLRPDAIWQLVEVFNRRGMQRQSNTAL